MKCKECPEYNDCRMKNDLRRKRHYCGFAKDIIVRTNADHIRSMNDDGLAAIFCYFLTSTLRVSGINATLGDSFQESFAEWLAEPYKEDE